jgi:thioredoxin 1
LQGIAPHFAAFSNRYKDSAVFIHVDVDKTKIENAADVKALPTFKFFKNGNLLGKFEGADIAKLESMIKGLK